MVIIIKENHTYDNYFGTFPLSEAISDQGEECGDYPVSEAGGHLTEVFQEVELTDNSGTVPVQFMYSNAAHSPEGRLPK